MAGFRIEGVADLRRALKRAGDLALDGLEYGVAREMTAVISEAKEQTPVDTGTLRASGTVGTPDRLGPTVRIEGGFGGAAQAYAVPVHENLTASHPVGNAKFLERPFLARASRIPANLALAVRAYLQRVR